MSFGSLEAELAHWKNLAEEYKQSHQDAKEELEEYQQSSQELEAEMEMQLELAEKKNNEYKSANERLQAELDSLRDKFEEQNSGNITQINDMQDELAQLRAYKEELEKYIRELEQSNDDLERAKRETVASLQDFEAKLNQAIERNAFLESELDDKDYLMESVQRLKDEARDLRHELVVTKKRKDEEPVVNKVKPEVKVEPVASQTNNESPAAPRPALVRLSSGGSTQGTHPLSPTARVSALNIVGDLLRKVGSLEAKLNAVKNTVRDQSPMTKPRRSGLATPRRGSNQQQGFVKISV